MQIREKIARVLAPGLRGEDEIREMVKDEVERAKAALPISANYDPNNEGYRRMTGGGQQRRDLMAISQDRMFEVAYFMYDNSAMTKRMAHMDKGFLFGEPITVTSEDGDVQEIITRFWDDPVNRMKLDFPNQMMWLGILGEQCWPVTVWPHNGHVQLGYVDPANIKDMAVDAQNVKKILRVDLLGSGGQPGKKMAVIGQDMDIRSKTYGRLVGDCFFFSINHPPNSPRGRSDYLTLFDWIDGLERYGYNYLERAEFILNFVWDVLLKGMNEDQIREWLRDNPPPEPGSIRAHNENVEWDTVAPDLKAPQFKAGFDTIKSFIMGAAGRPDAWFGGGGKAYQNEAEQFGQVPIKDLDERQQYIKHVATHVVQFQVDQAVIAGRLSGKKAETGFDVNVPEISKKDMGNMMTGLPQATTALTLAENQGWITKETGAQIFALIAGQFGAEINPAQEVKDAGKGEGKNVTEDYE